MNKLPPDFYNRTDVVKIAKELIGKVLVTHFAGHITSGRIVETEAYAGVGDRASHAFGGRRTRRTEIMYGDAGSAYVYLCYGIHHLFNVVTNRRGVPHGRRGLSHAEDGRVRGRRISLDGTSARCGIRVHRTADARSLRQPV